MRRYVVAQALIVLTACAPTVTDFSPRSGLPGTIVTVEGSGFAPVPSDNVVTIGGGTTRVISGSSTELRVVALRDVATGKIKVDVEGGQMAASTETWQRGGSNLLEDGSFVAGSELVEGAGEPPDLNPIGLDQSVLVIFVTPSDINPENHVPPSAMMSAREYFLTRLPEVNTYFHDASYGTMSVKFDTTPDWIPLTFDFDFYFWTQDDIDLAANQLAQAEHDLDIVKQSYGATPTDLKIAEDDVEHKKDMLNHAKDAQLYLQRPAFLFGEALIAAKNIMPDFDDYTDYVFVTAGIPGAIRAQYTGYWSGVHAEYLSTKFDIDFGVSKSMISVDQTERWRRITHELAHSFGLPDIYSETFSDGSMIVGSAEFWGLMGSLSLVARAPLYIGPHMARVLHYYAESNPQPPEPGNIVPLEWGATPEFDEPYDLVVHGDTESPPSDDRFHLIRLKVGEGLLYTVEVRQRPDGSPGTSHVFDPQIPLDGLDPSAPLPAWEAGVLITQDTEAFDQGNDNARPIQLVPPEGLYQVGDAFSDPIRKLTISVEARLQDRPAVYRVRVQWGVVPSSNPDGQFDLRIEPWGAPPWETVDIWVNSPKNDDTTTSPDTILYEDHEQGDETKPVGAGDRPWVKHGNTIFARVRNEGVQSVNDVDVSFYVNSPPGIGDNGNWALFDTVHVNSIAAGGEAIVKSSKKWYPAVDEHTCLRVIIHDKNGEVTFENNEAQENIFNFDTEAASPYDAIELDMMVRNPFTIPIAADIRTRGVPEDWFVALDKASIFLEPLGTHPLHVVIWTDRLAEWEGGGAGERRSPNIANIKVEVWTEVPFDYSHPIGGAQVTAHAVRRVEIGVEVSSPGRGEPFVLTGGVSPSVGQEIPMTVHIEAPSGALRTEPFKTAQNGGFNYVTTVKAEVPGAYIIRVFVLGGSLAAQRESAPITVLVP